MVCLHPRHRPKGGCHREIIVPRLRIPVSVTKTKGASSQRGYAFVLCGRWDLNPHEHTPTRSLVLPVCQFQHSRLTYGIISRAIFKCNPFFQKSAKFFGKSFQNFSKKMVDKWIFIPYNDKRACETGSHENGSQKWRNWQTRTVQVRVVAIP